jgi:PAS domain S-box-containing protein
MERAMLVRSLRHAVQRKRSVRLLLESEERFRMLVESVADYAIFMLDPAGIVISWNSGAERTYGYPAAEIIGQHFSRFFPPEAARAGEPELELKTAATDGRMEKEGIRVRRDGTQFTANLLTTALYDETGRLRGFAKVTRDVTERRKEQERLVEAERLRAIAEAMVGLAHESRNALQRSQAALERLARRVKDRPDALELIGNIQRAQDDLHRLYEEVREFAGPIHIQPRRVDVGGLLRDAWRDLARIRRGRKATLRERHAGVDLRCDADAFAMRQVLRNILENSLAACDDPVRIEVEFSEASIDDRSALRIALRDNGPGLNQEQRQRIFDAFYTTKARGTGLGMAIARRIIEAHQGTIAVGPDGEVGAEIVLALPRNNP